MKNKLLSSLIVVAISALCPRARAVSDFVPIQERAQGQSLTGAQQLNDSLYSNPASGAFAQVYSVEGIYSLPKTFGISILDTKTSEVGGGVAYYRQPVADSDGMLQSLRFAALGKVSSTVAFGTVGKTLWGPTPGNDSNRFYDGDSGMLMNLTSLQLGLTVRNILGGNEAFGQFREMALGGRFNYQDTLYFSSTIYSKWGVWKPYQYGIGAEYISPYYFSLKGGYRSITDNGGSYWSVGASILSPTLSLHYALEIPNQDGEKLQHMLAASLLL